MTQRCRPHGFRRYAVTALLRPSDLGLAQRIVGHADPGTTIRSYEFRTAKELAAAVSRRLVTCWPSDDAAAV